MESAMIRAKFRCTGVTKGATETVSFHPVMPSPDDSSEENARFWKATPNGSITMYIDNPGAQGAFELGKAYYVDFTPAD